MREYKKITKKKFLNELPTIPIDLFHTNCKKRRNR